MNFKGPTPPNTQYIREPFYSYSYNYLSTTGEEVYVREIVCENIEM